MNLSEHQSEEIRWGYLAQESVLILLFSYVILAGGTFNGLVFAPLRLVSTFLLATIGALWVALRVLRRWPFPSTPLDLPLVDYLLVLALTAAVSTDPRRSAAAVWELGLYTLLFYLFVDVLRHGWPAELLVKVLLIVGALVLAFAVWYLARWYLTWHAIWGWARPLPTITVRVRSVIGHPNWVAAFVNLLWPLALFRLVDARKWLPRIALIVWLLTAAVVLYFTSSRGGWLGTIAAIGTIGVSGLDLARLKHWVLARRWRAILVGLAALAVALVLVTLVSRQLSHPTHGGILTSRVHFWRAAWAAFRSSPILGTGPFTYGETYLVTHSVPPDTLYGVAHSYPINLAAESGLVGLAALGWLTVALIRSMWRIWHGSCAEVEPITLGAFAALVTCVVHSQFDSVVTVPYLPVVLALLLAIFLKDQKPEQRRPAARRAAAWVLPLGWVLLLLAAMWSLRASLAFWRGTLAANSGGWSAAARQLDQAAQRDPCFAYYHLQAGYAHGVRAEEDADELTEAITHYRAGISRSPNYALNAANLGTLLWQAGEADEGLAWMERAMALAPRSALFRLNLGRLYEELGQKESATRHYEAALNRVPHWTESFFWRATPFRAALKQAWLEAHPDPRPVEAPNTRDEWCSAGQRAMAKERYNDASDAFQRAVSLDPHYAPAYVGRAAAASALGREDEAERLLRTALMAEGGAALDRVRARFALARLYHEQGRLEEAVQLGDEAIALARDPSTHIPGQLGSTDYAWYLFHSETIRSSLLPQMAVITVTDEVADWMLELGAWHEEVGDSDAAARVYREILEEVPDSELARRRLAEVEG